MKLLYTEITPFINDDKCVELRDQNFLWSPFHSQPTFHSHPELELVFVLEGFGKRVIGNKIEDFEAGDMVFIGSNVPHVWLSDPVFYEKDSKLQSKVIVTYFNFKVFNTIIYSTKEFIGLQEMIQNSAKGIRIFGKTKTLIAQKLMNLSSKQGYDKIFGLLEILNLISIAPEKSYIIEDNKEQVNDLSSDKLVKVIDFMKANLDKKVTLAQLAEIASMTEHSFCRFFKKRMHTTASQYLNTLRVDLAKVLLIQTDKSINDITYQCGYKSASHFCQIFKNQVGESPLKYRDLITPL